VLFITKSQNVTYQALNIITTLELQVLGGIWPYRGNLVRVLQPLARSFNPQRPSSDYGHPSKQQYGAMSEKRRKMAVRMACMIR
jgi:lysophospholipase L1-like esterase